MKRTLFTHRPLATPDPTPLRVNAVFDRDKPCLNHDAVYTGNMPCTGVLRCDICLTCWDPDTGEVLPPRKVI